MPRARKENDAVAVVLRGLGLKAQPIATPQVKIGDMALTASRVQIERLPQVHLVGASARRTPDIFTEVKKVAAFAGTMPVVATTQRDRTGLKVTRVTMPDWVFAVLVKAGAEWDPKRLQEELSRYQERGVNLSEMDRSIGSGVMSALQSQEPA